MSKSKFIVKRIFWVFIVLFILIGVGASANQVPPKETINKFHEYPVQTLFHVMPAILFLLIGPFQLSQKFRKKRPKTHRFMGWVFTIISFSIGVTALSIVFTFPYGGLLEQIPISIFSFLFLFFLIRGIWNATRKKIQNHRKDLLRVYCLGLGASMFRVQIIPVIILGVDPKIAVPYIFWLGFGSMLLICEWYLWWTGIKRNESFSVQIN